MDHSDPVAAHVLGALVRDAVEALRAQVALVPALAPDGGDHPHDGDDHIGAPHVHRVRIATRRLRAVCSFGMPAWGDDPALSSANARLRSLARGFGPVRDLDVTLAAAGEGRAPVTSAHREELVRRARHRRAARAVAMVDVLGGKHWERTLERIARAGELGSWRGGAMARDDAPVVLAHLLDRWWWPLADGLEGLDGLDAHGRHRVRIRAKKLRYVAEMLGPSTPDDGGRRALVTAVKAVQDALGVEQDVRTGHALVVDLGLSAVDPDWDPLGEEVHAARDALLAAPLFWRG